MKNDKPEPSERRVTFKAASCILVEVSRGFATESNDKYELVDMGRGDGAKLFRLKSEG